jgi:hypothetical protein
MNEYQTRQLEKAKATHAELTKIIEHLDGWTLEPIRVLDDGYPYRCHFIKKDDGTRELMARCDEYDIRGRFEFSACGWPTYTDSNGNEKRTHPGDCWNPKQDTPKTTAAMGREPRLIANQIKGKILDWYDQVHAQLEAYAESQGSYHSSRADALNRLAKACRDGDRKYNGRERTSFYIQGLPGSTVSVDFSSVGHVSITLDTDEMIEVIKLLRELRAEEVTE